MNALYGRCLRCVPGCALSHLGKGNEKRPRVPELKNVILPTRHSSLSFTTSLKIFRSTWNDGAPWTAESALASRFRSTCSSPQSHSIAAGLAWLVGVTMGMNEDRGWENEGLGVSSDEQLSTTTAEPSCNIGSQGNLAQGCGHGQWLVL